MTGERQRGTNVFQTAAWRGARQGRAEERTVAALENFLGGAVKVRERVARVGVLVEDVRVGNLLVEAVGHANVRLCDARWRSGRRRKTGEERGPVLAGKSIWQKKRGQRHSLLVAPGESKAASVGVRTISAPSARRTSTFSLLICKGEGVRNETRAEKRGDKHVRSCPVALV